MNHQSNAMLKGEIEAKAAREDTALESVAFKAREISGRLAMTLASIRDKRSKIESVLMGTDRTNQQAECGTAGQICPAPPLISEQERQMKILDEIGQELGAMQTLV